MGKSNVTYGVVKIVAKNHHLVDKDLSLTSARKRCAQYRAEGFKNAHTVKITQRRKKFEYEMVGDPHEKGYTPEREHDAVLVPGSDTIN